MYVLVVIQKKEWNRRTKTLFFSSNLNKSHLENNYDKKILLLWLLLSLLFKILPRLYVLTCSEE